MVFIACVDFRMDQTRIAVEISSTDFDTQFYFLIAFENDLNLETFAISTIFFVWMPDDQIKKSIFILLELFVAYALKFSLNDSH